MKSIIKVFAVLLLAVMPVIASAQDKKILKQTIEITEIEHEDGTEVSVFYMPDFDQYYLEVGNMGVGGEIVQINFDPIFVLFIPLGSTIEEAQAKLEQFKEHAKGPRGARMETLGVLAFGYPNEEELEPVTVTARRLLITRQLEFSVTRGEWIRAAYMDRADIVSLLNGVKLHRKLHPNTK